MTVRSRLALAVLASCLAISDPRAAAGFFDPLDGPALDPRWVSMGTGPTFGEGALRCSSPSAAEVCAVYLDEGIDLGESGLFVFALSDRDGTLPQTWLAVVDRPTPPGPVPAAERAAEVRIAAGTANVGGTALVLEYRDSQGTARYWNGSAWGTGVQAAVTPLSPDDYSLVGLELDADAGRWRMMAWGRRSAGGGYTFDQGLRLFALTDWVAWTATATTTDPWLVLGDAVNDAGAGVLEIDWVRHDAGPRRHLWVNAKDHGNAYAIRHGWGYESPAGAVEFAVQQDRTSITVGPGPPGTWDDDGFGVKDPWVLFDPADGMYHLVYQSGNLAIGLASASSPEGPFVKFAGNPLVQATAQVPYVFAPRLLEDRTEPDPQKRYKLLYGSANDPPDAWLIRWSSAPEISGPWTDRGALMGVGTPGGFDQNGFTRPTPIWWGGEWVVVLNAKTIDETGKPWRVTWASGPTLTSLVPSGQILVDNGGPATASLIADLNGRIVTVDDTSGFVAEGLVEIDQDPEPFSYGTSRVRRVLDPTRLELAHGLDGFTVSNGARIVQVDAANRIEAADLVRSGDRWWLYVTPFQFMGSFLPGINAFDENTGLLTGPSPTGPFDWDHRATPVITRGSWSNNASNENISFVHRPTVDDDGDGYEANFECDDSIAEAWTLPGPARSLRFGDRQTLSWQPPLDPGGETLLHDTLRSSAPGDFAAPSGTICLETAGADTLSADPATPGPGSVFHYLVRPVNGCGDGPAASASAGLPRTLRSCP